jgi:acyl dehydratase
MEKPSFPIPPDKGIVLEHSRTFSLDDCREFARVSTDHNPLHTSPEYAAGTTFGKPVVHGVLLLSMFSRMFGNEYPGEGSVYLSQSADFLRPAYADQPVLARISLEEVNPEKRLGTFRTECFNSAGKRILTGRAEVLFPERYFPENREQGRPGSVFLRRNSG